MAKNRNTFEKRQRERDRQARAQAKRARRQERHPAEAEAAESQAAAPSPADEAALLEEFARLHQRLDDGDIDFDEFEQRKNDITERLTSNG